MVIRRYCVLEWAASDYFQYLAYDVHETPNELCWMSTVKEHDPRQLIMGGFVYVLRSMRCDLVVCAAESLTSTTLSCSCVHRSCRLIKPVPFRLVLMQVQPYDFLVPHEGSNKEAHGPHAIVLVASNARLGELRGPFRVVARQRSTS